MPPLIVAWHSHLVGMSSSLKEAFNLVQSGGAGIVGRPGGSYEAEEGEEGLLGGASHSHYAIPCQALPHKLHSLPYHRQSLATPFYTLPYFNYIVCHGIIGAWQTIYMCSISALCDAESSCRQVF